MAKKVTDWVRLAVEGATTDGRVIEREWLTGAAKAYNPDVYGARINCEHVKGYAPMNGTNGMSFGAYGDIVEVKTEVLQEPEKLKGKVALLGRLAPNDDLIALNKKGQKVYSSIEITPSFADTGTPYLLGMAVTDSPASLGTSYLQFCAQNPDNSPLARFHTIEGAVFTAAEEFSFSVTEDTQDNANSGANFFSKISGMLLGSNRQQARDTTELQGAVELLATSQRDALNDIDDLKASAEALKQLKQDYSQLRKDHDDLKSQLEKQPEHSFSQRQLSTGGNDTDDQIDY
ncbi:GPO family capsid scaffolding protein [Enterobacter ludwigii]|uniref:GPO family capsid scaffolding protein n=1 Tax=Enterobacter ludwigii TaxID=299767 RepID=UPI003F71438D